MAQPTTDPTTAEPASVDVTDEEPLTEIEKEMQREEEALRRKMAQVTVTDEIPPSELEMELQLEEDALRLAIRAAKQRESAMRQRAKALWDRVDARQVEYDMWLEAQQVVWAEQRGMLDKACLEPLGTIACELRRYQAQQHAAHDRKCAQVKARQEIEQGNLQWSIFCARLAHDSFGALTAAPLTTEQLVASAEVAAISIAGADLQVLLPDSDSDDSPHLHLRPASVEHLLAVECLWPEMDPADRQVLTSCYTPRETPHACMLSTLYVPLADTPHAESEKLGSARRLRPLRQHELQELLRVYVVRKPKPTAATLALPLVPSNDVRARELRTHDGDEVFEHLYCTASAPSTGTGIAYVLQLVPARESPEPTAEDADTDAAETSQLVELVQSGAVYETMKATISSFKLRCAGLTPPSHAVTVLEASLASAQKTRNANAALTAAISKEVSELRDAQGPPVRGDSKRRQ